MFKITLLFVSSGLNNFLKTAYMKFLHEKLFLIPWGQLFFHYELFDVKWQAEIEIDREQVFYAAESWLWP